MEQILERLGLRHGQFWAYYRAKNLNWWLNEEWIGFGDLRIEDIENVQKNLRPGEVFAAGWKELPPHKKYDQFFGDGAGCWIIITPDKIIEPLKEAV